jgi:hypothetical protein
LPFIQSFGQIRTDGYYQSKKYGIDDDPNHDVYSYLQFDNNGIVYDLSLWANIEVGEPKDWGKWTGTGTFEIKGKNIYCTIISKEGTNIYSGTIESEYKLQIHIKCLINNKDSNLTYYFIKR